MRRSSRCVGIPAAGSVAPAQSWRVGRRAPKTGIGRFAPEGSAATEISRMGVLFGLKRLTRNGLADTSKSGIPQGIGGSNPSLSATFTIVPTNTHCHFWDDRPNFLETGCTFSPTRPRM